MVIIELELQGEQLYEALSHSRTPLEAHGCLLEGAIHRKHTLHTEEIDGAALGILASTAATKGWSRGRNTASLTVPDEAEGSGG